MAPDFNVRPLVSSDCLPIAEQRSRTFGRNAQFVDCLWPQHWTPEGAAAHAERIERNFRSNPAAKFVVAEDRAVLDPATGKPTLVGCAEWKVYPGKGEDPGDLWPLGYLDEGGLLDNEGTEWEGKYNTAEEAQADRREYARFAMGNFFGQRREAIKRSKGKVWVLDVLAIEPSYQRKGAGTLLVEWGLKQADEEGAEGWVEGSPAGAPLYEKLGFVTENRYSLDLPKENWGPSPKAGPMLMRRPAKTKS